MSNILKSIGITKERVEQLLPDRGHGAADAIQVQGEPNTIPKEKCIRIHTLKAQGVPYVRIGMMCGVSKTTVYNVLQHPIPS